MISLSTVFALPISTKMNDMSAWLFSSADACEKIHSPKSQPSLPVRLTLFRPCIWSLKMWWSDASLWRGLVSKTQKHVHWGSHRWGVHLLLPPVFSLRWTPQINKAHRFIWLVKSLLPRKKKKRLWLMISIATVSLHDVKKTHSEARKPF